MAGLAASGLSTVAARFNPTVEADTGPPSEVLGEDSIAGAAASGKSALASGFSLAV